MSSRLGPLWGSFVCADVDPTRSCMRCSDSIVMAAVFAIFVLGRGILYMSTCSLLTKSSKGAFMLILVFVFSTDGGGWTMGTIRVWDWEAVWHLASHEGGVHDHIPQRVGGVV